MCFYKWVKFISLYIITLSIKINYLCTNNFQFEYLLYCILYIPYMYNTRWWNEVMLATTVVLKLFTISSKMYQHFMIWGRSSRKFFNWWNHECIEHRLDTKREGEICYYGLWFFFLTKQFMDLSLAGSYCSKFASWSSLCVNLTQVIHSEPTDSFLLNKLLFF